MLTTTFLANSEISLLDDSTLIWHNYFFFQRFIQYLASRNTLFNLSNFLDKSGLQGKDNLFIIENQEWPHMMNIAELNYVF